MTLAELRKQAEALGLQVSPASATRPYVDALRFHFLQKDYPNGLPYAELCPMQAYNLWDFHPRQQNSVWKSHDWVAQRKLNGCRMILHFVRDVGIFANSRNVSVSTYRRHELTNYLLFRTLKPSFTAVIDAEALVEKAIDTRNYTTKGEVTKTSLHSTSAILRLRPECSRNLQIEQDAAIKIHAFDITNWMGSDLRKKKLAERLGNL